MRAKEALIARLILEIHKQYPGECSISAVESSRGLNVSLETSSGRSNYIVFTPVVRVGEVFDDDALRDLATRLINTATGGYV